MVTIQKYVKAQSLEEAWKLNQGKKNRILGGMLWMRLGNGTISTAIDLCDLGLDTIEETDEEFSIGARVTLRELEQHVGLNTYTHDAVKNAVKDIVELYKGGIVSMADFVSMKMDNDILIRVIVKKRACQIAYMAVRNQSTDFPVLTCCVSKLEGKYRAVIGARPKRAKLVSDENGIMANGVTKEVAAAFASYVAEQVPTDSNLRGSSTYRTHLIHVLTERCVAQLENQQ